MRYALSALFFAAGGWFIAADPACPPPPPAIHAHFSPSGGCSDSAVSAINAAERTVRVAAYVLTADPIAKALAAAQRRGLDVQIILDKSLASADGNDTAYLTAAGIRIFIDRRHRIFHHKYIIIDTKTVITGSYNFTAAAEMTNAENLLEIHDVPLAQAYTADWNRHQQHSLATPAPQTTTPTTSTRTPNTLPLPCPSGNCRAQPLPGRPLRR